MRKTLDLTGRGGWKSPVDGSSAGRQARGLKVGFHHGVALALLLAGTARAPLVMAADVSDDMAASNEQVVFDIDFTNSSGVPTSQWLLMNAFELHHNADDPKQIEFHHDDEKLNIVVKRPAFGLAIRAVEAPAARRLRLHWGVADYPEGASYEHGVDNEAIMVYVFFGEERLPSGEMFIPDSPYFIGFYLCPAGGDKVEQPYVGHHYEKTGRYICVDHPGEGQRVMSEVDLPEEFSRSFGLDAMPPVTAISIEVDTTDSKNDGHAAAFLERLEFLGSGE